MCEFCRSAGIDLASPQKNSFGNPNLFQSRPNFSGFFQPAAKPAENKAAPEASAEEAPDEDDLTSAARDTLGFLRVSKKFAEFSPQAAISPMQAKMMFAVMGVPGDEQDMINKILPPVKGKKTAPGDLLMEAILAAL